jgi:hypothetical protein
MMSSPNEVSTSQTRLPIHAEKIWRITSTNDGRRRECLVRKRWQR